MDEEKRLIERIEKGLTTEVDAQQVREMLHDMSEIIAGIHHLATTTLAALERGDWRKAREDLERLAVIE